MKKILLPVVLILSGLTAGAQNYEIIKNMFTLTQYEKAKEELDKSMGNSKFASKPEAYILKASIYGALSMDEKKKNTEEGDQLTNAGDAAFKKFREMDASMALLSDLIYQNGPINLYSSYYMSGYTDYSDANTLEKQKKKASGEELKGITEKLEIKRQTGFEKLKKAVEYSDLLIERKILAITIDTNVLILAGITAEVSNHKNEAVLFYSRLADKRITGEGFESVYRFLVNYYYQKKDFTTFEKYKAIGQELYPKSEFFGFDKVDFAVGLETNFDAKVKAVEEVLATDPNNFKANEVLGEIIYDTLNPVDKMVPVHSNADGLEKKMVTAFTKAAAAKPGYANSFLYMGDHFIFKAAKVDEERTAFAAEMKARTKPGAPNSKEDIAKRDALDKRYAEALELARDPYEKVAEIYAAKPTLDMREKQYYKKAASYLADIFAFKRIMATKIKSPDAAKFAAEEKKWNDRWESIK